MEEKETNVSQARREIENKMGKGKAISEMFDLVELYAKQDCPILFEGETGVGKKEIVNYLHSISPRYGRGIVTIDCATLHENLVGTDLFGTKKGAFTGAKDRIGKIELANGGTLFLDNINYLSIPMQHLFLRILDERKFTEIGGNKLIYSDIRIVAVSNENFKNLIEKNRFCRELFYRFAVKISIPNLKVRSEDTDFFINKFMKEKSKGLRKREIGIETEAKNLIKNYSWDGNIRQLKNFIYQTVTYVKPMSNGKHIISSELVKTLLADEILIGNEKTNDFTLDTAIKNAIERALEESGGNNDKAIALLDMKRRTYFRWKKELNIE